jgi:hypothetical protein
MEAALAHGSHSQPESRPSGAADERTPPSESLIQ